MSVPKKLHAAWAICAFISFISFFNVQAAYFDDRGLNWIPITSGIVFFLAGAYFLYKVIKKAGSSRHQ